MDEPVVVQDVRPAVVSRNKAFRIFIGRLIVDFIETFVALLVPIQLFVPGDTFDPRKVAVQLAGPGLAAAVSALRRAWPAIRKWLLGEDVK